VRDGSLNPDEIDEKLIEGHLYTSYLPQPDPDLIIRTSGVARLSNFLIWQSAYSELFIVDVYWPDFREIDLERAIRSFQNRHRRYGK
jgi:tritrans,polycis-undecaprenyl-diphosphate synthase [geranylgeranyl-diphosphate specific]